MDHYRDLTSPTSGLNIRVNLAEDVRGGNKYVNMSMGTVLLSQVPSDAIEAGFCKTVKLALDKLQ